MIDYAREYGIDVERLRLEHPVHPRQIRLRRKDELKACGNGVVPQQAELALRLLLEGRK